MPPATAQGPAPRFVRIELPGKTKILQIAEVQVFSGGENVAMRGEARQNSTYAGAEARRAIDGSTAGEYEKGSVAHTNEGDDPWWEVDLKEEREIERIVVWNRFELPERMQGFHVIALDAPVKVEFVPQARLTFWKQEIGFSAHPAPDFPHEPRP